MARDTKWIPQGVIPAVLLPFHEDFSIDEPSFRAHLRDVAAVDGLSAITINAHSTEVASCTFDEQKRVLAIAKDEIGGRRPWFFRPDRSLWASVPKWRSSTSGASPARPAFPSSPFSTLLPAARAIR